MSMHRQRMAAAHSSIAATPTADIEAGTTDKAPETEPEPEPKPVTV
jgi:hypothetical protein